MSELPKGWVESSLIDLAKFIDYRGRTPKKTEEGIPLITAKNIKDGFINREPREFIAEVDYDGWMTRGIPKVGDVLLTTEAPLGNVAQIDIEEKFALAQRAICFQFYESEVERFIYYYLRSPLFNQELGLNSTGSTVKGIKAATLKKLPVHIAPLAEQKRIVEKLDEVLAQVDTIKARLDGIPDLLKRFRQSVLASAVSGKLTKSEVKQFEPIAKVAKVIGGLTKNSKRSEIETKLPYLRVANVYENELRLDDVAEIGVLEKELGRVLLKPNDILVVEGNGSLDQIGRVAIWDSSISPCVHQNHLIKIRSNQDVIDPKFILFFLMSPQGKREIVERATSGAGLYTLSISKISSIEVPIFQLEEQKEIVRLVDQYFAFADTIEAQVKKAQARVDNLTQSILAKAFRGELVPQDPNDEPADKLLERIAEARKEAEALAKAAKKAEAAKKRAAKSA